jgi:hypothetical protein
MDKKTLEMVKPKSEKPVYREAIIVRGIRGHVAMSAKKNPNQSCKKSTVVPCK